jgi:hypothetical protein
MPCLFVVIKVASEVRGPKIFWKSTSYVQILGARMVTSRKFCNGDPQFRGDL